MIYRLPMMGFSTALTRVTLRRNAAVDGSKIVSLLGSTGSPRHFSGLIFPLICEEAGPAFDLKHKTEALHFKVKMPGVDKKNLKLYIKDTFVVVEGVGKLEPEFKEDDDEEDEIPKKYFVKVNLKELRSYKVHEIEADLAKNGVLKVKVPRA